MSTHRPFEAAGHLAPRPKTRDEATAECWARHYAALAFAAYAAVDDAVDTLPPDPERGSRPDIGYLSRIANASLAAAVAFAAEQCDPTDPNDPWVSPPERLWDLTPELGALNGEWEDWLAETLDRLGINPADIDPRYVAADFRSPAVLADVEINA